MRLKRLIIAVVLVAAMLVHGVAAAAPASLQDEWINKIGPSAQRIVTPSCGFPSVTIAQSAQESGWGTSFLATEANNPFGRKCGHEPCIQIITPEYRNGVWVKEVHLFQVYSDLDEALTDYRDKLAKPWYVRDFSSPQAFIDSIASKYASDPNYARKVKSIIRDYDLEKYDTK